MIDTHNLNIIFLTVLQIQSPCKRQARPRQTCTTIFVSAERSVSQHHANLQNIHRLAEIITNHNSRFVSRDSDIRVC